MAIIYKNGKYSLKWHIRIDGMFLVLYGIIICSLFLGRRSTMHFYELIILGMVEGAHLLYLIATTLQRLILKRNIRLIRFIGVVIFEAVFTGLILLTAFYTVFPA